MEKDIERLEAQAIAKGEGSFAEAIINGYTVYATVIIGYRNMGAKRKPRIQWKVDGKVVAKADLYKTLIS